ncbi:GntP family permease [Polaribacter sp. Z022]|uniref:GntP family permease n=1 Tax=Polaribacter sp. Z022 TaxID=2927125 RepID=UPI0020222F3D|nr:GntP family permease [Polaribacter sp. Z022]MCL7752643.1 GntP family permease [Polaribacter sp. Z022]
MVVNLFLLLVFLLVLILCISKWKIHPFIALIITAIALGVTLGLGGENTISVVLEGFSKTLKWIAVIIIIGAFIGEVLRETGGAFRISDRIVKWVGQKKLPWAMGFTGYIVSIPVFVDVAYILLQPVVESLSYKSKKPVLYLGLSLAAGLTVAHTLIPPTPGPLAVASLLGVEMGRLLMINLIVASFAMVGGILWVVLFLKKAWLEYDKKLTKTYQEKSTETKNNIQKGNWILDVLPIIVPIVLISIGSFEFESLTGYTADIINFISIPLVAVFIGAFIAVFQIPKKNKKRTINKLVEQAIVKSALVIMITGAGGALGFVIKETGVQNEIVQIFSDFPFLGMLLPFLVAAMLTTATGSITVSLVGTASMLGPIINTFPMSPEIVAALIGCGSFCVFHVNSSFFWLLNRLHEAPPKVLYKTFTVQSLIMGLSGLVGVLILLALGF